MAYEIDRITWGVTYDLSVAAQDMDDYKIDLDNTWTAACRITKDKVNGTTVLEPVMTIANGVAECSIDTGDAEFSPGVYYYDIRLTDSDGNDYWSAPVELIIEDRNTPAS